MKRSGYIAMVLLVAVGAGSVFAEGSQEAEDRFIPNRGMSYRFDDDYVAPEVVTVTGEVAFDEDGFPTITAKGVVYDLMVPRYYTYSTDVAEGSTITVEGYLLTSENHPMIDEGENHLQVTKATVDGEEYELDVDRGPMGRMDDFRGGFDRGRQPSRGRMPSRGRW
jgi:hypothetical protein